jgi:hypothetical protein
LESFATQFKDDAFVRGGFRLHRASNMAHRSCNGNKNACIVAAVTVATALDRLDMCRVAAAGDRGYSYAIREWPRKKSAALIRRFPSS